MAVVWSRTLTTDNNSWSGYAMRARCNGLTGGGDQVRVRFVASNSQVFAIDNASIGVLGGATWPNMTTNPPVRLTFSGANGFSIAAGATITSDWVDLVFTSSDVLVPHWDFITGTTGIRIDGGGGVNDAGWKAATDDFNNSTVTGYSSNGFTRGINQIEGQFVSGGQPLIKRLGGVPFAARNRGVW